MKCQFCSKPKIYEVVEIEANKAKTNILLCQDCFVAYMTKSHLQQKPQTSQMGFTPEEATQFVKQMMKFVEDMIGQKNQLVSPKAPCPKCNTTLYDIAKTSKLGCPACYDWYEEELNPILSSSHATPHSPENLVHMGKKPKNFKQLSPEIQKQQETEAMQLIKLKYKLKQAIEKEDYETAAKIRDIIADMKKLKESKN